MTGDLPDGRSTKSARDAVVRGLQDAMLLAEQAANQYQGLQGLRPPTVAVYQATRPAAHSAVAFALGLACLHL